MRITSTVTNISGQLKCCDTDAVPIVLWGVSSADREHAPSLHISFVIVKDKGRHVSLILIPSTDQPRRPSLASSIE
jgi:hypothetical protein